MPKQVDHDQYRRELAARAVGLFSQHGYSGLGMRRIAEELGISKSALYHYFPSKEALFAACTELVTNFEIEKAQASRLKNAPWKERVQALIRTFRALEAGFQGELSLLIDYLRSLSPGEALRDKNLKLANDRYLKLTADFVGAENAKPVLCLLLGALLERLFAPWDNHFDEVEGWLLEVPGPSGPEENPREGESDEQAGTA